VDESANVTSYTGTEYDLFRNSDDFDKIVKEISRDRILKDATRRFSGLRLMRQDPFQCYVSFIVSSNSSIQNIRLTLQRIAKKFGKKVKFDGMEFHLFPAPKNLAEASMAGLLSCGLGYRAEFVKKSAISVKEGLVDLESLKKSSYDSARDALLGVDGVGNKVADCIMLFSLEKLEAFPLDRWVIRSLQEYYPEKFSFEGKALTDRKYRDLHQKAVKYFGPHAGYCQQFLFKMIRETNKKKW
jgi:N-glycosylase/DNA lyase